MQEFEQGRIWSRAARTRGALRGRVAGALALSVLTFGTTLPAAERSSHFGLRLGTGLVQGWTGEAKLDRVNPLLAGTWIFEVPLNDRWSAGGELEVAGELVGENELGGYGEILGGGFVAYQASSAARFWFSTKFGVAGYQIVSAAWNLGGGSELLVSDWIGVGGFAGLTMIAPAERTFLENTSLEWTTRFDGGFAGALGASLSVFFGR